MRERTVEEMEREICSALPDDAVLTSFSYDSQCFGNIVLRIEANGKRHTFVTDRGEIHHNGLLVDSEAGDPFPRLLLAIQCILNGR